MTASYSYVTIATNVAALSMTVYKASDTVTPTATLAIKDLGTVLEQVFDRDVPLLQPDIDVTQFVTGSPDVPDSFGTGGTAVYQSAYTLTWMYFHCQIGAYRNAPNLIRQQLYQNTAIIQAALSAVDTSIISGKEVRFIPVINVVPGEIVQAGEGNNFYGCPIAATVVEWQNL